MLWKAALMRRISRMVFKCRLSLTSPVRTTTATSRINSGGVGFGNKNGLGGFVGVSAKRSSSSSSATRADNAYLLAVFFVFFLLVMIVTQVMVMRSELSASTAGKSHPRSFRPMSPPFDRSAAAASLSPSSFKRQQAAAATQQQEQQERPARPYRFGRQPAPFGRVLAADRAAADGAAPNTAAGRTPNVDGHANAAGPSADLINDTPPLTAGEWLRRLPLQQGRRAWVQQLWLCFQPGRPACPWQPVVGRDKCFVYSAYLDDTSSSSSSGSSNGSAKSSGDNGASGGRNPSAAAVGSAAASDGVVRVIGVARTKKPDKLWCQLGWALPANGTATAATSQWISVPAQIRTIREHWNLRYSAVFILCPLQGVPKGADAPQGRPQFVSVSTKQLPDMPQRPLPIKATSTAAEFDENYGHWYDSPTGNLLPIVRYSEKEGNERPKHQLTVCVKPLHYSFNRVSQLVEFIEIHRLLGVSHFTFYNHTVGGEVDCVLRRYMDQGLVDVLPWTSLDVVSQKEIRTEGIFASLNDCLYRHMYDSQYLLMIDLDELIVPRTKFTLTDMIASTTANGSVPIAAARSSGGPGGVQHRIGAYYFRNAFFYLSWPDDGGVHFDWDDGQLDLISLRKTRRNVKLHPHRIRSKYICRPRVVVEVGNHFVWEFRAGHVAAHVPDTLAVMHHYRTCEFGGETCLANPSVQDRSAWKYGDSLVTAVRMRFHQFAAEGCPALLNGARAAGKSLLAAVGLPAPVASVVANGAVNNSTVRRHRSPLLS